MFNHSVVRVSKNPDCSWGQIPEFQVPSFAAGWCPPQLCLWVYKPHENYSEISAICTVRELGVFTVPQPTSFDSAHSLGQASYTCHKHPYKVVPPQWCLLVYNPNNYRYNPLVNPSEIVLMFTNLANELGHHLVGISRKKSWGPPKVMHPAASSMVSFGVLGTGFQCHGHGMGRWDLQLLSRVGGQMGESTVNNQWLMYKSNDHWLATNNDWNKGNSLKYNSLINGC